MLVEDEFARFKDMSVDDLAKSISDNMGTTSVDRHRATTEWQRRTMLATIEATESATKNAHLMFWSVFIAAFAAVVLCISTVLKI
jgi:hypothetical protein